MQVRYTLVIKPQVIAVIIVSITLFTDAAVSSFHHTLKFNSIRKKLAKLYQLFRFAVNTLTYQIVKLTEFLSAFLSQIC